MYILWLVLLENETSSVLNVQLSKLTASHCRKECLWSVAMLVEQVLTQQHVIGQLYWPGFPSESLSMYPKTGNTFCKIITRVYEKLRDVDRSVAVLNEFVIKLYKDSQTWCHSLYYFTIYCSTCFEC